MLTIVHGSDTTSSRKFFIDEKTRSVNSCHLRSHEVNLTSLAQVLEGGTLFEEIKNIFIEEFFTEKTKNPERDAILSYLIKHQSKHNILIWEGRDLDRGALNALKGVSIRLFKLPSSLFTFLDSIKPGNGMLLIKYFHQSLSTSGAEIIFYMLVRQLRIMICLQDSRPENISEVARLSPWQKNKLVKQAASFSAKRLRVLYDRLFEIEKAQKTGNLSSSLIPAIDFFLAGV